MKSLVIIPSRYPCQRHPTWHVFVRQIAHAIARQGIEVTIITPLPFHRAWLGGDAFLTHEDAGDGKKVTVYRPRCFSWGSRRIGKWNTFALTIAGMHQAVRRVVRRHLRVKPDAIYGHFLYPGGGLAVLLGRELGVASFPAAGEISLDTLDPLGDARGRRDLLGATAFIANSKHLARLMQQRLGLESDGIGVFPNGVDQRVFYPRDQQDMRRKHGIPADGMLAGFVGGFERRKGATRVAAALKGVDGVSGVFVGGGTEPPDGDRVAFCGRVPHDQVPEFLSTCDFFVLPTTDEGCCNAILEAMACGLPVISSNGEFNDGILTPEVSIRVDPMDVGALRAAIVRLRDDVALRKRMSHAALEWSEQFSIDRRAQCILQFMDDAVATPANIWKERK